MTPRLTVYGPESGADVAAWVMAGAALLMGLALLISDRAESHRPGIRVGGRSPRTVTSRRRRSRAPLPGPASSCHRGDACRCSLGAKCGPRVPVGRGLPTGPRAAPRRAR